MKASRKSWAIAIGGPSLKEESAQTERTDVKMGKGYGLTWHESPCKHYFWCGVMYLLARITRSTCWPCSPGLHNNIKFKYISGLHLFLIPKKKKKNLLKPLLILGSFKIMTKFSINFKYISGLHLFLIPKKKKKLLVLVMPI